MDKTELIHIHSVLYNIKRTFIKKGIGDDSSFKKYNALGISPRDVRASKERHKKAAFVLLKELKNAIINKNRG